jgi:cytoskeletal protein RodZ
VLGLSELGQALKEAREEKGMTLDDIQNLTKIQMRYLIAIEAGDYSKLPGNFYTRAFMKSYAEAVGIDPKELFNEHSHELPKLENEVEAAPLRSRTHKVKASDSKFVDALPKIAIVVVLVVILIGIWVFMQKMTSGESDKADGANPGVVLKDGSNLGTGKAHSKDPKTTKDDTDAAKNDAANNDQNAVTQQLKLENTSGQVSHYTLSGTDQFKIEIDAKEGTSSWITAKKNNPNGDRLYFDFVSKGVKGKTDAMFAQDLSTVGTLYLKVGSAPNTIIKINDQPFEFPNTGIIQQIYITYQKS